MTGTRYLTSTIAGLLFAASAAHAAARAAVEYVPPMFDEATCMQGATTGRDVADPNFITSSDWYFIGAKPPCTSAASLKKYCDLVQTRAGYVFEATAEAVNNDPVMVGSLVGGSRTTRRRWPRRCH